MSANRDPIQALVDDAWLSLDDLCRATRVSEPWLVERVEAGLIAVSGDDPGAWRFDAPALHRVRHMARLERDFDAVPELAALVLDLQGEIARLRSLLRRAGLDG
jgi:chaperone modulatory protein CbpM